LINLTCGNSGTFKKIAQRITKTKSFEVPRRRGDSIELKSANSTAKKQQYRPVLKEQRNSVTLTEPSDYKASKTLNRSGHKVNKPMTDIKQLKPACDPRHVV
jgi:hypothetical protein